jgi:hypothetical protein
MPELKSFNHETAPQHLFYEQVQIESLNVQNYGPLFQAYYIQQMKGVLSNKLY